jgi:hypothetical protein
VQAIRVSQTIDDAIAHGLSKCLTETDLGLGPCTVVSCSSCCLQTTSREFRCVLCAFDSGAGVAF